jgi:hypothetical protein
VEGQGLTPATVWAAMLICQNHDSKQCKLLQRHINASVLSIARMPYMYYTATPNLLETEL